MSIASANLFPDNSTDTNTRAWGKFISDALTAAGLIKTNDTGQVDWATVIKPTTGQIIGYEIRQFTDNLQATAPVFFKIEYAGDSSTGIRPQIWLTFGKGSNGTGTLTGTLTPRTNINVNSTTAAATHSCVASGSTNRFSLSMWFTFTNNGFFVSFERTKDSNGNDTADGLMVTYLGASTPTTLKTNQYYPFSGFVPAAQDLGVHLPLGVTSGTDGADVNYYPNFLFRNGTPLNPGITHFAYFMNDVTPYNQAIVPVYGINRNYYFLGNQAPFNTFSRGAVSNVSVAILYE